MHKDDMGQAIYELQLGMRELTKKVVKMQGFEEGDRVAVAVDDGTLKRGTVTEVKPGHALVRLDGSQYSETVSYDDLYQIVQIANG